MEIVLMLLSITGLSFLLSQTDGPFGLIGKARNLVARVPVVGPMVFTLLTCSFCLGFWCSIALYLTTTAIISWSFADLLVWSLGGAMFNTLLVQILERINRI